MENQERSFWEVALDALHAEDDLRGAYENLEWMKKEHDKFLQELTEKAGAMVRAGEVKPGRYQWGNSVLCVYENGSCALTKAPEFNSVTELPGYREWSKGRE